MLKGIRVKKLIVFFWLLKNLWACSHKYSAANRRRWNVPWHVNAFLVTVGEENISCGPHLVLYETDTSLILEDTIYHTYRQLYHTILI